MTAPAIWISNPAVHRAELLLQKRSNRRLESHQREGLMTIDPKKARQMADDYTAAWNSGSAQAVAEFYAKDGGIVINRG